MIKIFNSWETDFSSNGEKVLHPIKAVITKEDNGDYELRLEVTNEAKDYIVNGNIVVADTPWGQQGFRIYNPKKKDTRISCDCKHLFFDSTGYVIVDSTIIGGTGDEAIRQMNNSLDKKSPFKVSSDITRIGSYSSKLQSFYESLMGLLGVYGGHLVRDNFNIVLKDQIGKDKGVTLQYGKNISMMTASEDWSKVCTKILPVGRSGFILDPPFLTTFDLPESSSHHGWGYDVPYTKTVTFEQDIDRDAYPTEDEYLQALEQDLRKQALAYLDRNCLPLVSYSVKAEIDGITDLGDIVEVYHEKLGVNLLTNVISVKYDCIQQKMTEVNFGNFTNKLKNLIPTVTVDTAVQIRNEVNTSILPAFDDKLSALIRNVGDRMLVGSQTIYDHYKVNGVDLQTLLSAYDYTLIDGVFRGIVIPDGYEKGYKISFQYQTQGTGGVEIHIGNMLARAISPSGISGIYRSTASSRVYRQAEIRLQSLEDFPDRRGLNLVVASDATLSSEVWNVTIDSYLIRRA